MIFDAEYYNGLHSWIQTQDGKTFSIDELTEDYDKFVFHIKYYIDNRTKEDLALELNSISETESMYGLTKHTQIRVLEFFEGKVSDNQRMHLNKAVDQAHADDRRKKLAPELAKVQEQNKEVVSKNLKTPGLFQ